jgi:hypothetical protein
MALMRPCRTSELRYLGIDLGSVRDRSVKTTTTIRQGAMYVMKSAGKSRIVITAKSDV